MEKTNNHCGKVEKDKEQIFRVETNEGSSDDGGIPMALWDNIVSFLDIPQLGKCAQVSKGLQAAVMKDVTWEVHVKKLLKKLFDGKFYIEPRERRFWKDHTPVPLSKRPLKSTSFRSWYVEWKSPSYTINIHGKTSCRVWYLYSKTTVRGHYSVNGNDINIEDLTGNEGEFCGWLFEDVPLRSYYKEAGNYAYLGYQQELEDLEAEGEGPGLMCDYDGLALGLDPQMFQGLPNIRLFHGLGGYQRKRCYYGDY